MTKIGYINERWPESNSHPGVFYILCIEGQKRRHYYTVDDLRTAVAQCRYNNLTITRAVRMCNGAAAEFIPETSGEKSQRENENHCESIALECEMYANGDYSRCPECGEQLYIVRDEVGDKYKCPHCHNVNDIDDYEQASLYDYFEDMLDIDWIIGSNKDYKACRIMVACGGPNIYINTWDKQVELYWWTESAKHPLSYQAAAAIDEWAEEYWECIQ